MLKVASANILPVSSRTKLTVRLKPSQTAKSGKDTERNLNVTRTVLVYSENSIRVVLFIYQLTTTAPWEHADVSDYPLTTHGSCSCRHLRGAGSEAAGGPLNRC